MHALINLIIFQIGWWACVLAGAWGYGWAGPLVVALGLGAHFASLAHDRRQELYLVIIIGVVGSLIDALQIQLGVFTPLGDHALPIWLAAMWFNFPQLLHHSLAWLIGRYWLAAVLGFFGGPLAYWTGLQFDAIAFPNFWLGMGVLAVAWALITPAMFWLAARFPAPAQVTPADQPA